MKKFITISVSLILASSILASCSSPDANTDTAGTSEETTVRTIILAEETTESNSANATEQTTENAYVNATQAPETTAATEAKQSQISIG